MMRTLSLCAAFLLALSSPSHALTKVKLGMGNVGDDVPSLLKGETLVRTENGPSFSRTGERKDMVIEYRAPLGGRVSAGFSMTHSYEASDAAKTRDSSAMFHFRLKF
jgi:hypothetical protein